MNKCKIENCSSTKIRARGLCASHWTREQYGECKNKCNQPARDSKGLCNNCHKRGGKPKTRRDGTCSKCNTQLNKNLRCPACNSNRKKNENLVRKYGITLEQWTKILTEQGNSCKICYRDSKRFVVDHDHTCCPGRNTCGNCIRGIICENCNRALGLVSDSTTILNNMIRYLEN